VYVASFVERENERLFTVVMKHSATPANSAAPHAFDLTAEGHSKTPISNKEKAMPDWLYSPAQLSHRWGITGMTLRRWRKAGKLKALHIGRQIRFSPAEIARFEAEATA